VQDLVNTNMPGDVHDPVVIIMVLTSQIIRKGYVLIKVDGSISAPGIKRNCASSWLLSDSLHVSDTLRACNFIGLKKC